MYDFLDRFNDEFEQYEYDSNPELGEYDEDGCYQIGPFNDLMEEFLKKANTTYTDLFKERIRSVIRRENKANKLSEKLWARKRELDKTKEEIKKMRDELDNAKEDIAYQYLNNLGLFKFHPGQTVYEVTYKTEDIGECTCEKGTLYTFVDGIKYEAKCPNPNCYCGKIKKKVYSIREGKVESIYFNLIASSKDSTGKSKVVKTFKLNDSWSSDATTVYVSFDNRTTTSCNGSDPYGEYPIYCSYLFTSREEAEEYIKKQEETSDTQTPIAYK